MEENNSNETFVTKKEQDYICFRNHCWKMCLGMIIAAFLGGFLAVYFVADQIMERSFRKHFMMPAQRFEHRMFNDIDRQFKKDMKDFGNIFNNSGKIPNIKQNETGIAPLFMPERVKVKSEIENGNYNVIVSLKPFLGDENKVNYNVEGKKLTVFGESTVTNDNSEQDIAFSYDFLLPDNADTMHIKKYKDGKKLVISVPIRNKN